MLGITRNSIEIVEIASSIITQALQYLTKVAPISVIEPRKSMTKHAYEKTGLSSTPKDHSSQKYSLIWGLCTYTAFF